MAFLPGVSWLLAAVLAPHGVMIVNDARSHGAVGDGFLSLNEAIGLNARTLDPQRLSAAELRQVTLIGGGGDYLSCRIDAAAAPVVTAERDLDAIPETIHGFDVGGFNGTPILDLGTTRGIVATGMQSFHNLVVRGGSTGLTVFQGDTVYGSLVDRIRFERQQETGFKLVATVAAGNSRLLLLDCVFAELPTAIDIEDLGTGRTGWFELSGVTIRGAGSGLRVSLGQGGDAAWTIDRLDAEAATAGLAVLRATAADDRALQLYGTHCRLVGAQECVRVEGCPNTVSRVMLRSIDCPAAAGTGTALVLGPLGARFAAEVDEARLSGRIALQGGPAADSGILLANARVGPGSDLELASTGAPVRVHDSILDHTTVRSGGSGPVMVTASRLVQGSVTAGAGAPIALDGCHLGGARLSAAVTSANPLPAPQLGSMEATPLAPAAGSLLALVPDLPAGLSAVWLLGPTARVPTIGPRPLHVYLDLGALVILPVVARGNLPLALPIPADGSLRGADLFVQLAVVPDPGVQAPPLSLPPGRRVIPR